MLEWASFWANVALIIGAVLTAFATPAAIYLASRLAAEKDAALVRFQTESKVAIATADARAAEANTKAAEAAEGTAKALSEAASANERTQKIELEAVVQRERAAQAELALLELKKRVEPRTLTADQRSSLVTALKQVQTRGPVKISFTIGDGEALAFADQVRSVLVASGWNASEPAPNSLSGSGIALRVKSAKSAPNYAAPLQRAFELAGVALIGVESPEMDANTVQVLVLSKP